MPFRFHQTSLRIQSDQNDGLLSVSLPLDHALAFTRTLAEASACVSDRQPSLRLAFGNGFMERRETP